MPEKLRKIHQNNGKNDRTDAEILARMVRLRSAAARPGRSSHRAKSRPSISLTRALDVLVGARTKRINAARGLTKALGSRLPRCTSPYFAQRVGEQMPKES